MSGSCRLAASRACAGLRLPALPVSWGCQPKHGSSLRRHPAYQVVEAGQAGEASRGGGGAALNLDGGGLPWQRMAAALDKRQAEAAWHEFMQLLEQGILPPVAVCDRLISGERAV